MRTTSAIYSDNCTSHLSIAVYWAKQRDWEKTIESLRAARRAAEKAGRIDTAAAVFTALRRCQDAMLARPAAAVAQVAS